MIPLIYPAPFADGGAAALAAELGANLGIIEARRFPDDEALVRVADNPAGRAAIVVAALDRPDPKLTGLWLLLRTLGQLGAASVTLVAPYLPYMRQDIAFRPGEAVSSRLLAEWLGPTIDNLVTVDPHLHRIHDLGPLWTARTELVRAAPAIADWLRREVPDAVVVGPDEESEQWAAEVARLAEVPHTVLQKTRRGDRDVEVTLPDPAVVAGRTPVLVDDIISTARTMVATVGHLQRMGLPAPICIGVHAVFAGDAEKVLADAGAARIVTCDTLPHPTNTISLRPAIADAVRRVLALT